jgi:hypothetical protein
MSNTLELMSIDTVLVRHDGANVKNQYWYWFYKVRVRPIMSFVNTETETAFDLFYAERSFDDSDGSTAVDDQQSSTLDCDESFQDNPFRDEKRERKDDKEISFLVQSTMSNMVFLTAGEFIMISTRDCFYS